jgi:chitin disaccharide deacetylase
VDGTRYLIVTADDFGIGPATTRGILDLAVEGRVTNSVLLVNSPYAGQAVQAWHRAGQPLELGWHPCLTLDWPIAPTGQVASLVDPAGRFWLLGAFLRRLITGRIRAAHIEKELRAQVSRFRDLVGRPPSVVNSHHHVQVFPPVGGILRQILREQRPVRPYIRRIREPWRTLFGVPGARVKRGFLSLLGRRGARLQARHGFPGNDWLAGITDPPCVADPRFLARWLTRMPGRVVELTCHPGYVDATLVGRDCTLGDGQLPRRCHEFRLLQQAAFSEACRRAGFVLVAPSELAGGRGRTCARAA